MDKAEANERFRHADSLYRAGQYTEALAELEQLSSLFPQNPHVLDAKARTLEHLDRGEEALAIFDRLLDEFQFEKSRPRRDRLAERLRMPAGMVEMDTVKAEVVDEEYGVEEVALTGKKKRFRIKPVRTLLLIAILAGMYFGYIGYPWGIGLIAAYFVLKYGLKLLFKAALFRLFTMPFKMKGKALAGATAEVHGFEWTDPPATDPEADEEEGEESHTGPLRYVWIDVTITPQPRTQGFTHWEPGELALAPSTLKYRSPDDLEKCFQVREVRFVNDGKEEEDEGYKINGPQRLKVLAGVPMDQDSFRFAYYFETFGDVRLK